jgi:hypothetical protein
MEFWPNPWPSWPPGQPDVVFWIFDYTVNSTQAISIGERFVPWSEQRLLSEGNLQDFLKDTQYIAPNWPNPTFNHPCLPSNISISDALFEPGQSGIRLISRKFWDAPWERYPHLM